MQESDFILPGYDVLMSKGKVGWKAPSNIALIKYWGKKGDQIPANPSVSLTLNTSNTSTTISYEPVDKQAESILYDFVFEGQLNQDFRPKIDQFLGRIAPYIPFLNKFRYRIESSNSFPHSSGIASSASAFAALALCFMEIERKMYPDMETSYFWQKASFLARLGSGSACRSILGPVMHWGHHPEIEGSHDQYAVSWPLELHPVFRSFNDLILLVDQGKKKVSSTVGHGLMKGHSYADARFGQAYGNLSELKEVLEGGDLNSFVEIVESEALTLHAMMMTSRPYYLLMKPNTMTIIERIWQFRQDSGLAVCFTLDAGANVHLLFPDNAGSEVMSFAKDQLFELCEEGKFLEDRVGNGAQSLL